MNKSTTIREEIIDFYKKNRKQELDISFKSLILLLNKIFDEGYENIRDYKYLYEIKFNDIEEKEEFEKITSNGQVKKFLINKNIEHNLTEFDVQSLLINSFSTIDLLFSVIDNEMNEEEEYQAAMKNLKKENF